MKNLSEEDIKIKFNNYMEQIKVPKNLGGIIMEDFEKIKNEGEQKNAQSTSEAQETKSNETTNKKQKNKSKKALKISLGSVAAVVLVGVGIFTGTKLVGDKIITIDNNGAQNSNLAADNNAEVKTDITKEESEEITAFLNDSINNPFTQISYDSPENLLENIDKSHEFVLRYAIFNENNQYSNLPTSAQKSRLNLADMPYKFISEENLIKFLKEKMNYTYPVEQLRNAFSYKESEKGYLDMISDSTQSDVTLEDGGYKLGNKYYITVTNENNKKIELVLIENDNSYYFYSAKITDSENFKLTANSTKQESVTESEIAEIEKFVNDTRNQAFILTNYNNPQDLFVNEKNLQKPYEIIKYSLNESSYAKNASSEENKILWKETGGEPIVSTKVVDIKDIIKFLNEKTNYNYSEVEVKNNFKVNTEIDKYVLNISDTLFGNYKIKSASKSENKYFIKLYSTIEEKNDIDVVFNKINGQYYFYSCNLNNFTKLSQEKITQLEKFINDPGNHAFVYMNYEDATDIISDTYDAKKAQTISQSLAEGEYAKTPTEQERQIIGHIETPTYVISLENLEKFLEEKLGMGFGEDVIKKSFSYEYNEKLGKFVILTAGALDKDNKITEGYKAGNYKYYLTLSRGQKVVLFERNDGSIFFESCTGYTK